MRRSLDTISSCDDGAEHYAAYAEHARTLRTWLVTYGIGGPVLILSQDAVWNKLINSGSLHLIAGFFLTGVVLQGALSAINKSVMWVVYYGTIRSQYKKTCCYKLALCLSGKYGIDLFCDVVTMGCFAYATYKCFTGLL